MSRKLLVLAALAAVLLPLSAEAQEEAADFGDRVDTFFSGAASDVADAADTVEEGAKDAFSFFSDKVDHANDDDLYFKAPWDK